ncbi:Glutamate receptor ionotropic, kainate 3 [Trichoplax sp. H2]|nr:Glutamate receptor ionotropic, kainate 3 [Trichoplax sp. H2]|eukprot:RDD46624.1 Glutamate receptor ionotropic, kainate 3 [Trichoplax sp. H2]
MMKPLNSSFLVIYAFVTLLGFEIRAPVIAVQANRMEIPIAVLADGREQKFHDIIQLAADHINGDPVFAFNIMIKLKIYNVTNYQPFLCQQEGCRAVDDKVWAIIGPSTSSDVEAVQYMATSLRVPQVAPIATYPGFDDRPSMGYLVRMSPSDKWQSRVLVDIFQRFHWSYAAIIVSNTDYGCKTIELISFNGLPSLNTYRQWPTLINRDWKILAFETFNTEETNNFPIIDDHLMKVKNSGAKVIILSCLSDQAAIIIKRAHRLGLTGNGFQWVLFDNTITEGWLNLDPPGYLTGAIGIMSSNDKGELYGQVETAWKRKYKTSLEPVFLRYYDAVIAIAYGLRESFSQLQSIAPLKLSCLNLSKWENGQILLQNIVKSKGPGSSGPIRFDARHAPYNPNYEVVNLVNKTWKSIGSWNKVSGATINGVAVKFMDNIHDSRKFDTGLQGKHFNVTTKIDPPFLNYKADWAKLNGNDRYEGFITDLLNRLATSLKFTYTLQLVKDDSYGGYNAETNKWSGMVGELTDQDADIAAGAFSISVSRAGEIDFTIPFLDQGATILIKKPEVRPPSIFQCFAPFTGYLWLCILGLIIILAVAFFTNGLLNPFDTYGLATESLPISKLTQNMDGSQLVKVREIREWKNGNEETISSLTVGNAIWNSLATFLQQGNDRVPIALSGRITLVAAWIMACIVIATYTANLAAFLTVDSLSSDINSIQKLASQSKVKYGTVSGSSVHNFFQQTRISPYYEMASHLVNVPSTEVGVNKTRQGNYAFLWDAALLSYYKSKYCNLITVGQEFRKDGYALGLRKGSPFTNEISIEILKLRQSGYVASRLNAWYKKSSTCTTETATSNSGYKEIDINHMYGVFVLVLCAIGISLIVLCIEWIIALKGDIDPSDPTKPQTFSDAMRLRFRKYKMVSKIYGDIDEVTANPEKINEIIALRKRASSQIQC